MTKRPKRVQINGQWHDVSDGWGAGTLELRTFMGTPAATYKANEPYAHITNLFFVYDSNGNKVGEFNTDHRSYSGCVTGLEM